MIYDRIEGGIILKGPELVVDSKIDTYIYIWFLLINLKFKLINFEMVIFFNVMNRWMEELINIHKHSQWKRSSSRQQERLWVTSPPYDELFWWRNWRFLKKTCWWFCTAKWKVDLYYMLFLAVEMLIAHAFNFFSIFLGNCIFSLFCSLICLVDLPKCIIFGGHVIN